MLNRKIRIQYKDISSYMVRVNKGVPQGSALGPILWNYAIQDTQNIIDGLKGLDTDVLAFADDITIIAHGYQHAKTQALIDEIIELIESKGLSINADKSEAMTITGPGKCPNQNQTPSFTIQNIPIRKVTKMTILGIPITHKLALDTKDENLNLKISTTKKYLKQLHSFQIVDNMQEWKILIESLIRSILVQLSIPILSIDEKGRRWSNNKLHSVLTYVFGWPRCISKDMIRVLTNIKTCEDTVYQQLIQGCASPEHMIRHNYQILAEIFVGGGLSNYIRQNRQTNPQHGADDTYVQQHQAL